MWVGVGRETAGGVPFWATFPSAKLKLFSDRLCVAGPFGCEYRWDELLYLDLNEPGVGIVLKTHPEYPSIGVWSPWGIQRRVGDVVIAHDLPVSMRSTDKPYQREWTGDGG